MYVLFNDGFDCDDLSDNCGAVKQASWPAPAPKHPFQVTSVAYFARGATGRVCEVMRLCPRHALQAQYDDPEARQRLFEEASTLDEVQAWAESAPGGYLDLGA